MATLLRADFGPLARRREILEWHAGLPGKGPAQVLGVSPDADPASVKAAFAGLVKRFHPDSLHDGDADLREPLQEIFIRTIEAYRQLQAHPSPTPARPVRRAAAVAPPRRPKGSPPAAPRSMAAPALDPEEKHRRVAAAMGQAAASMAASDSMTAVAALHEVLGLADEAERRRLQRLLARAYVSEPRWRRYAVALLGDMLRESPRDAEAFVLLGALYHREGLMARAEATLRRALEADPENEEARAHLRAVTVALERRRASEDAPPRKARSLVSRLLSFSR